MFIIGQKIIVTDEKLPGNIYEIGLLTKEDAKNRNMKFMTDKVLTDAEIKSKLQKITNCYVETIKRVTKYKRTKEPVPDDYGVVLTGRYSFQGGKKISDSLFFPDVLKQYVELGTLEDELKDFFGTDFEILVYSPR